ncbi:MAG: response regulator [Sulfurimonas sp.]|nr:response regulator [Sulfurimonas sp.]
MVSLKELKQLSCGLKILYVEDDAKLREIVADHLKIIFDSVSVAQDGGTGLKAFHEASYDLIITDIQMPNLGGLEMVEIIKKSKPNQEIIITTAYSEISYFMDAIRLEVSGYIIKPIDFEQMKQTLFRIVEKIVKYRENTQYKLHLEEMVNEEIAKNRYLEEEKIKNYEETLLALVDMVERRDTYTAGHSRRVANYCKMIAKQMNYADKECDLIYRAGILHDIGKITTPDSILLKPSKLEFREYALIKEHASIGAQMLHNIPMYIDLSGIVAAHHEHYDGKGYPLGLKETQIPPLSRIMIIADAFDAMTTDRIYKPRMVQEEALAEILRLSGAQFDPEVVPFALQALEKVTIDEDITQKPKSDIEKQRFAYFYIDQSTGIYNQNYLDLILLQNKTEKTYTTLTLLNVHNFTKYNNKYGWSTGDLLLQAIAKYLREKYPDALQFRFHGDDFVSLFSGALCIDFLEMSKSLPKEGEGITFTLEPYDIQSKDITSLAALEKIVEDKF